MCLGFFPFFICHAGNRKVVSQKCAPEPRIHQQLSKSLDIKFPRWRLPKPSKKLLDFYDPYKKCYLPNFVWGDYDGNGKKDYALKIITDTPSEMIYHIACLDRGETYEIFILSTKRPYKFPDGHIEYWSQLLWPHQKGESIDCYDCEISPIRLKTDAVELVYPEKAAVMYIFEKGTFKEIVTGD